MGEEIVENLDEETPHNFFEQNMEDFIRDRKTRLMKATFKRMETMPMLKAKLTNMIGDGFKEDDIKSAI